MASASDILSGRPHLTDPPRWRRVRTTLAKWAAQGGTMASAARHRHRRPALVISSFTSLDVSAWHTFGVGAGLLVLGGLLLVFEAIGGDE